MTDTVTWTAVLVGGPADGRIIALPRSSPHPPDHYRVVLSPPLATFSAETEPDELVVTRTGLYSLAYTLGQPSMDDNGCLRYTWRGEVSW